jgi:hypothetical protein
MFLSQPGTQVIGLVLAWQAMNYIFGPMLDVGFKMLYPEFTYR